jgi:hypothetical protein
VKSASIELSVKAETTNKDRKKSLRNHKDLLKANRRAVETAELNSAAEL